MCRQGHFIRYFNRCWLWIHLSKAFRLSGLSPPKVYFQLKSLPNHVPLFSWEITVYVNICLLSLVLTSAVTAKEVSKLSMTTSFNILSFLTNRTSPVLVSFRIKFIWCNSHLLRLLYVCFQKSVKAFFRRVDQYLDSSTLGVIDQR